MNDNPEAKQESGKMMSFSRSRPRTKMEPAHARRQGDIVGVALAAFGKADAAMAFLNGLHTDLGARPLDVATQSDAGFQKVRQILAES